MRQKLSIIRFDNEPETLILAKKISPQADEHDHTFMLVAKKVKAGLVRHETKEVDVSALQKACLVDTDAALDYQTKIANEVFSVQSSDPMFFERETSPDLSQFAVGIDDEVAEFDADTFASEDLDELEDAG